MKYGMKDRSFMDIVHYPVMQKEVLEYLKPASPDGLLIDATLGEGGHSELFLKTYPSLSVVGVDADPSIMAVARERLSPFGERVRFFNMWFNTFFKEYPLGDERPDLILFDLGISVFHYERSKRGFSFQKDEPLDMRIGSDLELSAKDIVNEYPERELSDLLFLYGEEQYARRIAKAIVTQRKLAPITTTKQLAELIYSAVPEHYRHERIHPATRSFQALRIAVNGELARLEAALRASYHVLKVGGRIGVISFHSLEDRQVKQFFKDLSKSCTCPPEWPICTCGGIKHAQLITPKALKPTEQEVASNSPSRSAKFRVIEKLVAED